MASCKGLELQKEAGRDKWSGVGKSSLARDAGNQSGLGFCCLHIMNAPFKKELQVWRGLSSEYGEDQL